MRHAKHSAVDFEILWDAIVESLRRLTPEGKFQRLSHSESREMHIVLWDVRHCTAIVLADLLRAKARVINRSSDAQERGVVASNAPKKCRTTSARTTQHPGRLASNLS